MLDYFDSEQALRARCVDYLGELDGQWLALAHDALRKLHHARRDQVLFGRGLDSQEKEIQRAHGIDSVTELPDPAPSSEIQIARAKYIARKAQ